MRLRGFFKPLNQYRDSCNKADMFLNSGHSPGKLIDIRHPSEVLRQWCERKKREGMSSLRLLFKYCKLCSVRTQTAAQKINYFYRC